jgi:nitronate monooxygenase
MAGVDGDLEALALYAGQSSGLTDDILHAGEVVERLATEAETCIGRVEDLFS